MLVLFGGSCSKLKTPATLGDTFYTFPGLGTLTSVGDGTFKLDWEKVPADGVEYEVFSRTTGDYDFSKPASANVIVNSWTSPVLDFKTTNCFIVRYVKAGIEPDANLNEKCTSQSVLSFGAKKLLPNDDGTWTLSWDPAPFSGATYSVFSRLKTGVYNFAAPVAQSSGASYRTVDMIFAPDTCFVVRFGVSSFSYDTNVTELCVGRPAYSFAGLTAISVNKDGSYLLTWSGIPGSMLPTYSIFSTSTPGVYDFSKPVASVSTTSYSSPIYPIDQNRCFVVRFSLPGQTDSNLAEVCSKQTTLSDFAGVSGVSSVDTGVAQVTWVLSTNPTVAGYRIYQGTDFSIRAASVGPTISIANINGLAAGKNYSFGVRAFDQYGREDSNTKTISVGVVNLTPPTFAGLVSATLSGNNAIMLGWNAAGGSPTEYHVYRGVVDANLSQPSGTANIVATVNWTNKIATVPAGTSIGMQNYLLSGVGDDQTEYIGVRAATISGVEDTNTSVIAVSVPENGAPLFAGVSSIANNGGKITANWLAPVGQTSTFLVSWTDGITTTSQSLTALQGSAYVTGFTTPTTLAGNKTYTFTVHATDRFGNQDVNSASQSIALGNTTPPAQLSGIVATPLDENRIQFSFATSASPGVTGYIVRQCVGAPAACTNSSVSYAMSTVASTNVSGGNTLIVINGLLRQTQYTFNLTAINSNNIESTPSQISASTLKLTPPVFGGVTTADFNSNDASLFRITWSAGGSDTAVYYAFVGTNVDLSTASLNTGGALPSGVSRVTISPQTASPLSWGTPTASSGTISLSGSVYSLDLPNLTTAQGNTYYVIVWAADNVTPANVNQSTVELSKSIPVIAPPTTPTYSASWSSTDGGVKITWNNIAEAQQYSIYRSIVGQALPADSSPTFAVSAGTLQYIDVMAPGTNDGVQFRYRVKSKNNTLYSTNADDSGAITIPDRVAPVFSGITGAAYSGASGTVTLSYGAATDTVSGLKRFQVYARGQPGVSNITAGNTYALGTVLSSSTSATVGGSGSGATLVPSWVFENGQKYDFRVEAEDNVGNISSTSWSADVTWGVDSTPATLSVNAIAANTIITSGNAYDLTYSVNRAGTFYVACGSTAMKSQAISQSDVNGGSFPDVSISFSDLNSACAGTGTKTIAFSFIDIGGIANGNTVTNSSLVLSAPPSSSAQNVSLYKFGEGTGTQGAYIELRWTNPTFASGDTLTVVRRNSSTPPASVMDGSVLASGLSQSTKFYQDFVTATVGNTTYAVFVCNIYGTCSTDVASNQVFYGIYFVQFQNYSQGGAVGFAPQLGWSAGVNPTATLAVSKSRKALAMWDGVSSGNGVTLLTLSYGSFFAGSDSTPYDNALPWEQRYFRASGSYNGNMFAMSDIRTWANVPPGMVFVGKDDWPAVEWGQVRHRAFDFAIDKYMPYETTTAANPGGTSDGTQYPGNYNSVLKSSAGQSPLYNNFYDAKQGCANRTAEPELSSYAMGTSNTLSPRRRVHLITAAEYFAASYGTPESGGAGNCNIDNRNSGNAFHTGTADTVNCVSRYGATDMIGNLNELTDEYFAITGTGPFSATRTTFYGTSFAYSDNVNLPTPGTVSGFDYQTLLPNDTSGSAVYGALTYFDASANATVTGLRGGNMNAGTRFHMYAYYSPTQVLGAGDTRAFAGRCAIDAPAPKMTIVQNDSVGSKAQFYWNINNADAEGTLNVVMAFGSDKRELDGWNGESTSFTNGGRISFTTSGGQQSFSGSTLSGLGACATYTPVVGTGTSISGSCSLDLSAAPFNLAPWTKRFFRIFAYNKTISGGGPGPGAISSTMPAAYAPPGMVMVAKEDWPVENTANQPWDYKTGSASGVRYDGVVGPFDYAIDKYQASRNPTATNLCNIGNVSGGYPDSDDNCALLSVPNANPNVGHSWFDFKQECESRTTEPSFANFVGNTTLARTATTADPRRRVHLTTDAEYFVANFQTPDVISGSGNCNGDINNIINTGTATTADCISRYGALDLIGNEYEFTDSLWVNVQSNMGARQTFYGTGGSYALTDPTFTLPSDNYITGWNFSLLLATTTASSGIPAFFQNYFEGLFSGNGTTAAMTRGVTWPYGTADGRFATNLGIGTSANGSAGGRCALAAP